MAGHKATRNAKARKKYKAAHPPKPKTPKQPAVTTEKLPRGRPPIPYRPDYHPLLVRGLAASGLNVNQIAAGVGISKPLLYTWRDEYPELAAALTTGRAETVACIKASLIKKAQGFSIPLEEVRVKQKGEERTVQGTDEKTFIVQDQEREKIRKTAYYPPDPKAAAIVLVNLDPEFRTERTAMELTGPGGEPLAVEKTIIVLPDNHRGPAPKVLPAEVKEMKDT